MLSLVNNQFKKKLSINIEADKVLNGYGVFETLKVVGGRAQFMDEHLARFFEGAQAIGLKIKYTPSQVKAMITRIIKAYFSNQSSQKLKIIALEDTLILTLDKNPYQIIKGDLNNGLSLKSFKLTRSLPEIKSISNLECIYSFNQVARQGFDEALLINHEKKALEGSKTNLFYFENDLLYTPEVGILKGIIRGIILKHSPYKIRYKTLSLTELKKKKSIFITNSLMGLVAVNKIDDTPIKIDECSVYISKLKAIIYEKTGDLL